MKPTLNKKSFNKVMYLFIMLLPKNTNTPFSFSEKYKTLFDSFPFTAEDKKKMRIKAFYHQDEIEELLYNEGFILKVQNRDGYYTVSDKGITAIELNGVKEFNDYRKNELHGTGFDNWYKRFRLNLFLPIIAILISILSFYFSNFRTVSNVELRLKSLEEMQSQMRKHLCSPKFDTLNSNKRKNP